MAFLVLEHSKTTLMDVIALRKRSGTITGEVRLNGWLQDPISFRRASGYVEQFDVQSPELSVRETVLFSAQLRLDSSVAQSQDAVEAFVDGVLKGIVDSFPFYRCNRYGCLKHLCSLLFLQRLSSTASRTPWLDPQKKGV
jgi:hypothetical protein